MEQPYPFPAPSGGYSNSSTTVPPCSEDIDSLKEQLDAWTKEQHHVATQVVIKDDWFDTDTTPITACTTDNPNEGCLLGVRANDNNALVKIQQRFNVLAVVKPCMLYGGVDVSF
jgi:hypothetical protein